MGTLTWLIGFQIAYVISVALHEIAHAKAASWAGLVVHTIQFGSGRPIKTWRWRDVDLQFCGYPSSGLVRAYPLKARGYRWRNAVMTAAGPLANALLLCVFGAILVSGLPLTLPVLRGFHWLATVLVPANALILLLTLYPRTSWRGGKPIDSDGLSLIRVWRVTDTTIYEAIIAGCVLRACRLAERDKPNQARRWMRRALERDIAARPDYLLFGVTLFILNDDMAEAQPLIVRFLSQMKESSLSLDEKLRFVDGLATLLLGVPFIHQHPDLLSEIEDMMEQFPQSPTVRGTRGGLSFELGNYDEAERELTACLEHSSQSHDRGITAAYLAALARIRGDSESIARFEKVVRECGITHPIIERLLKQAHRADAESISTS